MLVNLSAYASHFDCLHYPSFSEFALNASVLDHKELVFPLEHCIHPDIEPCHHLKVLLDGCGLFIVVEQIFRLTTEKVAAVGLVE